jgi:hypothetical protein
MSFLSPWLSRLDSVTNVALPLAFYIPGTLLLFENCSLPDYYAASSDNVLPTSRINLSVPSSGFKNTKILKKTPRIGLIGCPETWARNCHFSLRNTPEKRSSQLFRGGCLKSSPRYFAVVVMRQNVSVINSWFAPYSHMLLQCGAIRRAPTIVIFKSFSQNVFGS